MLKKLPLPTWVPIFAAAALTAGPALAEDPMMVSVKRLSLETAQKIAQGAIDACREKGIQIGVTVVDRDGVSPDPTARHHRVADYGPDQLQKGLYRGQLQRGHLGAR